MRNPSPDCSLPDTGRQMTTGRKKQNVILCGFMGTGKSSVGRRLAELTGYGFLDMDAVIESEERMSIPDIFATRGEPAFRALESGLVDRICRMVRQVVATGGGTVANPENLAKLKRCGTVVALTADIETIFARVGSGEGRPMLKQGDTEERIRTLLQKRAEAYAQADLTIDTSQRTIEEVARRIMTLLQGD